MLDQILELIGKGSFGTVYRVFDNLRGGYMVIKAIKTLTHYPDTAKHEYETLKSIELNDPDNKSLCIRAKEIFHTIINDQEHICITYAEIGKSLNEIMQIYKILPSFKGLSLKHVQLYGYQILKALAFIHDMGYVHADMKPDNIIICSAICDVVRLIIF